MMTVILCGGLGTRLSEETELRPKPMVEIGGRPILWHIMRGYAHWGFREFVLALRRLAQRSGAGAGDREHRDTPGVRGEHTETARVA